ncbi:PepSY domain-containing protein [Polaribacter sp. Asnod6-C07]|uniref:PepSY domain-containing protein n=1 Tax=Polaribacter sp. Asnod6-C07 TaxID=3160582 RepID=UPI0038699F7B
MAFFYLDMGRKTHRFTRKIHRYLGLFIGIQFLFWTIGGLYFSWNDMDDVHGETLLDKTEHTFAFSYNEPIRKLLNFLEETDAKPIKYIEAIVVNKDSLLRVTRSNDILFLNLNKNQYKVRKALTKEESIAFVKSRLYNALPVKQTEYLTEKEITNKHEYRGNPLPVFAITLEHETNTTVYVHPNTAKITKVRNDNWRKFDFLWMLHVMDFETRDHITNWVLRAFSVLGLLTILSGFYLFFISSPTLRKWRKKIKG